MFVRLLRYCGRRCGAADAVAETKRWAETEEYAAVALVLSQADWDRHIVDSLLTLRFGNWCVTVFSVAIWLNVMVRDWMPRRNSTTVPINCRNLLRGIVWDLELSEVFSTSSTNGMRYQNFDKWCNNLWTSLGDATVYFVGPCELRIMILDLFDVAWGVSHRVERYSGCRLPLSHALWVADRIWILVSMQKLTDLDAKMAFN